ncbi:MAG: signal peptidase II [Candidatus Gracilibacteria bacterium]|nr:signal peptidase II [Candidatus Gracilibacteria bacterium]
MRIFFLTISLFFCIALDMGSKIFVEDTVFGTWKEICVHPEINSAATVEYCRDNIISFTDFFSLHLSYNSGIAFSLPIHGIMLQIITLLLIGGILYQYFSVEYPKKSKLLDAGYVLILSGALSHAYERIFVGHVVDFIAVKYFAILNIADIFISVGAFLLILAYVIFRKSR